MQFKKRKGISPFPIVISCVSYLLIIPSFQTIEQKKSSIGVQTTECLVYIYFHTTPSF